MSLMKKVVVYHSLDALSGSHDAESGNADAASSVFLSLPWFRNLDETALEPHTRLRIYGIEPSAEQQHPCMALPMCHAPRHRLFAPRRLRPLANFYTSLFGPLTSRSEAPTDEVIGLLVHAITRDVPRWDTVSLTPLEVESPVFDKLLKAFRSAGMAVQSYFCFGNWYLDVNGRSYREYFDALPSRMRNTITRKSRQLEREGRIHIRIIANASEAEEGLSAYEQVHDVSWKTREPFPAFIPGLVRLCARHGWLRMGVAYIDGKPVAAQIWIVHQRIASIYKLAYDERFSQFSVGSILTARLMQHVIDTDRVSEVDFLNGDEPYKKDWMSHRRERWGIVAFNLRTFHGALAALRHLGARAIKNGIARSARAQSRIGQIRHTRLSRQFLD
ncbi:GNAT family N-acetyltransferase [Noviherbaspirillum cavernae]|uniref:GNAT family N-acetyltransferase n=1 Tax=Noviherbaspirillum cavernae TaxID=2320862 RepID=A0A418X3K6_9BURK|nr:GNAT family N-acetyltransferase [Noviherbaspirillum cavernae]RJG07038.1 GNAT family N-acetyltransferase [Noviherbaspirillum cavernae]